MHYLWKGEIPTIVSEALQLLYPHLCLHCGKDVFNPDALLCFQCLSDLPRTGFESLANNPVEKIFHGRLEIKSAHCAFHFSKGGPVQSVLHALKYKGNKNAGLFLGRMIGRSLAMSPRFNSIDMILPLPLFADKERKRGYNQSTLICEGIAEIISKPIEKNILVRKRSTETQTRKQRTERWLNVENSFVVAAESGALQGKHILLVDDVITTGATIEACGQALSGFPIAGLSVATAALASK